MWSTLSIYEEYTNEHALTFNADKNKCIIFKQRSATTYVWPSFSIASTFVRSWPPLGNIICETDEDYECISARRIQLIGPINNVLSTSGELDPITRNNMLY